jgi:NADH-quinone oxidoreductase subunit G/NADP-reducing hydrogenase subunit HndD
MVTLTVDNQQVTVPKGTTILSAAKKLGIHVPTLCYDPRLTETGACRICSVEVNGQKSLVTACTYPVSQGMEVKTNTKRVREARKTIVELLLANHPFECLTCVRNNNCELQNLAIEYNITEKKWAGARREVDIDASTTSIVRDPEKCILCGKCVKVCKEIQNVYALDFTKRGFNEIVEPAFHKPLADSVCILCGQCLLSCPTAAIQDKSMMSEVMTKIDDPNVYVTVQTAPAIRASIGECFGLEPGSLVTHKLVTALRRIGFNQVFDTDFGADLTIVEEGTEFISRLKNDGPFPMLTSCSPGWVKFMEHFYPEFIPNMSSCKSPQQITGILTKTYFSEKMNIDPKKIYNVSIMPCSAKKFEIERPEMIRNGIKDVDAVLTTREAARLIKLYGINDLISLPNSEFDAPLGISTGAGVMFGITGGVMEASLRTVSELITGETFKKIEYEQVRGLSGVKEGSVIIGDKEIRVAIAHGLGNVRKVLDSVKRGDKDYHFIEVMTCPGGCIGGGGQPIPTNYETRKARIQAIYKEDRGMSIRKSHENPAVQEIYETFLKDGPYGKDAHDLLHTKYKERKPQGI